MLSYGEIVAFFREICARTFFFYLTHGCYLIYIIT